MKKILGIILLLSIVMINTANADRRYYVWTYQYATMIPGHTELELYQTTKLKDQDEWEFRLEIETGLTEKWDLSIYQIFKQKEGEDFVWDAVQMRTRIRFGEQGIYPVDPLLYLEYNRKVDLKKPNKFEGKLILAKSIDNINISINPLYEFFFAPGSVHEIGMDAGLSIQLNPTIILGVESIVRKVLEDGTSTKGYFGPTISVAVGEWWYAAGVAFGLNDASDDARVRFLMGIGL